MTPAVSTRTAGEGDPIEARAGLYGVLSRIYGHELTPEFARELTASGFGEMLQAVAPGGEPVLPAEPDFEALAVEYARLFVGPGPAAPPYASVYRHDDAGGGRLWGETTGEVKGFMAHYGLEVSSRAIPDHVALLFEFVERVLQAGIAAAGNGDDRAAAAAEQLVQRFQGDYLAPWIKRFLGRVRASSPQRFYAAVAELTWWFMELEMDPASGVVAQTRAP